MSRRRIVILTLAAVLCSGADARAAGYHVINRIAGPDGSWDYVRVDAVNNRVLVARGGSVMSVDLVSRVVTAGLAPGSALHDALPVNGGKEVMVTNGGSASVVFIDAMTAATLATLPAGKGADAATFDARSGLVLVMNHQAGDVTLIDPKGHKVVATIAVGGNLEAAAVDGAGHAFVNVEDQNQIAVIDLASRKVTARYPLTGCDGPTGIVYDAADRMLIAACDGATVFVDAATGKALQTLPTGAGADGVAFDPRQKLAFVPSGRTGTLSVIAVRRGKSKIAEVVKTQVGARTIGLDERTGRLYLPTSRFGASVTPGGRPPRLPGTFELLVVGK